MANKTEVKAEAGKQEYFVIREFEAPREDVFKAFTDPEIYPQWEVGGGVVKIENWDYKTGGSYRYNFGKEDAANFGVLHEVAAPERIIYTFEFSGVPERGHVALIKVTFEELDSDRCKVTVHIICDSVELRDELHKSGMGEMMAKGFDKLDTLL